jgi:hypothetical protein
MANQKSIDRATIPAEKYAEGVQKVTEILERATSFCDKREEKTGLRADWLPPVQEKWEELRPALKKREPGSLKKAWDLIHQEVNPALIAMISGDTRYNIRKCEERFPELKAGKNAFNEALIALAKADNTKLPPEARIFSAKAARALSAKALRQEIHRLEQMSNKSVTKKAKAPKPRYTGDQGEKARAKVLEILETM